MIRDVFFVNIELDPYDIIYEVEEKINDIAGEVDNGKAKVDHVFFANDIGPGALHGWVFCDKGSSQNFEKKTIAYFESLILKDFEGIIDFEGRDSIAYEIFKFESIEVLMKIRVPNGFFSNIDIRSLRDEIEYEIIPGITGDDYLDTFDFMDRDGITIEECGEYIVTSHFFLDKKEAEEFERQLDDYFDGLKGARSLIV